MPSNKLDKIKEALELIKKKAAIAPCRDAWTAERIDDIREMSAKALKDLNELREEVVRKSVFFDENQIIEIAFLAEKYIDCISNFTTPSREQGDYVGAVITAIRDKGFEIVKLHPNNL